MGRFFFFKDTATTEIYTLSLHDALPISTASCTWTCAASWSTCAGVTASASAAVLLVQPVAASAVPASAASSRLRRENGRCSAGAPGGGARGSDGGSDIVAILAARPPDAGSTHRRARGFRGRV